MRCAAILAGALAILASLLGHPACAVLFSSVGTTPTDPTSAVLPSYNDAYANWQNAGLASMGGIPTRATQCGSTITPSGITPPASGDDAANIAAAIAACTAGDVVQLGSGTFQVAQSELPILVDKGVSVRGNGACANSATPYCNTEVNVYDGAIPDWDVSTVQATAICGITSASTSACSAAGGVFLLSPSINYNWGWGGCNLGTTPTSCGTTLTADAAKGDTTVSVASTANFSVGQWVLIDEAPEPVSTTNPTGGANLSATSDFLSNSGSPVTMRLALIDTVDTYSMAPSRLDQEIHRVASVGSGTLTFDDPLTMAYRQSGSHDARVFWPTVQGSTANPFLTEAGVENMSISKAPNGGVEMVFCAYCWVRNVEVYNWIAGAVNMEYSARDQVEGNYFHDCADCENNGNEYPLGIDSASTETLVDNNIIVRGGKGMVGRGSNTAVVAYNYQDDTFYMQAVIGDYWVDMGVNGSHFGGTHHFLIEGNWGDNCDGDEVHGNAIYHVFFRNQCTGIRTTFVDPSQGKTVNDAAGTAWGSGGGSSPPATPPAPLRAAGPQAFNYWYGYVGNVLGLSGVTTTGGGWVYQCAFVGGGTSIGQGNKCIWMSGWVGGEWPGGDSNLLASASPAYIFRHGDYDYVTPGIADWATGYSHTLPNSFYLSAEPSYFSTVGTTGCIYPWPWVTPTGSSQIQSPTGTGCTADSGLPAKARFDAGTPFVQP
jgi:hypothetical protein